MNNNKHSIFTSTARHNSPQTPPKSKKKRKATKRPKEPSDSSNHAIPAKRHRSSSQTLPQKNAVAMLNELRQGLVYNLEGQSGPVHAPIFTMTVNVDGQIYTGHGRNKKIARIQAAAAALRSFIQFKDGAVVPTMKHSTNNFDFTSDEHTENGTKSINNDIVVDIEQDNTLQLDSETISKINKNIVGKDGQKQTPDKGPVMLLYELYNDVDIECKSTDGVQHSRFKMVATVNDRQFEGTGPSKKMAKNAAAKAALAALCNISYSPMQTKKKNETIVTNDFDKKDCNELPQTFADAVGKMVIDKFMELTANLEQYSRRKVLAGIVMIENNDLKTARVLTVSTGTKCINGEHMSVNGAVVNDSHAEIVSRRCLIDYFYSQLELHIHPATAKKSIFERYGDMFRLKKGINFHLYINTAPCGDARIFSPHEDEIGIDKHPNRKARGQLRTKIESGEGTIPVKSSDGIQTWDGVLQGQRLLTMSCSDKVARWNVLGLQGALLASLIEPIYLQSIVLGSLLHPEHMYRAVCGRIENAIQGLPPPYFLNKPKFALVTSTETRAQIKAPNFGINWTLGNKTVEVVNSLTGKPINGKISRITKYNFFSKYVNLLKKLPNVRNRIVRGDYGETKANVVVYQMAKTELFAAFKREDLGNWLKKPIEQDQFLPPE